MHTPIPWIILPLSGDIVHPTGKYLIPGTEWNDTIAHVWDRRDGHVEHDRRLIAAAPELLAALERVLDSSWNGPIDADHPARSMAASAIVKAKGETT